MARLRLTIVNSKKNLPLIFYLLLNFTLCSYSFQLLQFTSCLHKFKFPGPLPWLGPRKSPWERGWLVPTTNHGLLASNTTGNFFFLEQIKVTCRASPSYNSESFSSCNNISWPFAKLQSPQNLLFMDICSHRVTITLDDEGWVSFFQNSQR